jgi:hypothetical protein
VQDAVSENGSEDISELTNSVLKPLVGFGKTYLQTHPLLFPFRG